LVDEGGGGEGGYGRVRVGGKGENGGEDKGEDRGEEKGEAVSPSRMDGSSASAATAASMSILKSKVELAGVVQEENTTPEHI
jgi:hypothetical protein